MAVKILQQYHLRPVKYFFSNLFTYLLVAFIYAFCKAGVHTVLILIIPLVLFYCFAQRPRSQGASSKNFLSQLLPAATLLMLCAFFCFIYILPRSIEGDVTYYAKLASYFKGPGIENNFHYYNDLLNENLGLVPYHYFELWFASFVSLLSGFTSLVTLKFIVYPYLMALCFIGMAGLYEHISQKKASIFNLLIIFSLSFLSGLAGQYLSIKCSGWDILLSLWYRPNFILNYLAIIPLILSLHNKDRGLLAFSSMLACFFSVTLIPALLPAVYVFLAYEWLIKREKLKTVLLPGIYISGFVIMYFLFYSLHQSDFNFIESRSISSIILTSFKIWKATLGTFLNMSIRCLVFVPLFYWLYKKNFIGLSTIVFFTLISVLSIGTFQLLNQLDNSYQVPHFAFCVLGCLLTLTCLYLLDKLNIAFLAMTTLLLLVFSVYANKKQLIPFADFKDNRPFFVSQKGLSVDFAKRTASVLETLTLPCGFYFSDDQIKRTEQRYRTESTLQPLQEIAYYTDKSNMICVNKKEQMLQGEGRGKEINQFWYNSFPSYSLYDNPYKYIEEGKLGALLISNNGIKELPDTTSLFDIKKTIIIKDTKWSLFINQ
ncbi:MAG TPA: hypothetical protein VNY73_00580 [Bacteroidia bacterium]|nr:hypothetical protein [Bacteroidia bacterium]